MPADRLGLKIKGRIAVGADADITVFDPARVIDRATFEQPGAVFGRDRVRAGEWNGGGERGRIGGGSVAGQRGAEIAGSDDSGD